MDKNELELMSKQLAPCPFCGNKAKLREITTFIPQDKRVQGQHYCIAYCTRCRMTTPVVNMADEQITMKTAIKLWNDVVILSMIDELKPCPFCGRDVELVRACNKNALPDAPDVFYIVCPNCGFLTHMEQSKEQAIQN